MVNTRRSGRKNEKEFELFLQDKGYITLLVKGSTKFNQSCDFWGLFDIISFKPQEHFLFVQVKTQYLKKVHEEIEDWMTINRPPDTVGVYAVRKKGVPKDKRWKLYMIYPKLTAESIPVDDYPPEIKELADKVVAKKCG